MCLVCPYCIFLFNSFSARDPLVYDGKSPFLRSMSNASTCRFSMSQGLASAWDTAAEKRQQSSRQPRVRLGFWPNSSGAMCSDLIDLGPVAVLPGTLMYPPTVSEKKFHENLHGDLDRRSYPIGSCLLRFDRTRPDPIQSNNINTCQKESVLVSVLHNLGYVLPYSALT